MSRGEGRWYEGRERERERAIRGDSKCRLMWSHTMQPHTDRIRNRAKRSLRPLVGSMNERSRGEARSNFHADLPPRSFHEFPIPRWSKKREKKKKYGRNEKKTCYGIIESIIGSFRNNLSKIVVDYCAKLFINQLWRIIRFVKTSLFSLMRYSKIWKIEELKNRKKLRIEESKNRASFFERKKGRKLLHEL